MPDGGPAAKSAYGGPTGVRIPAAISPVGSPDALPATKPKPKSPKPQGDGAGRARRRSPLAAAQADGKPGFRQAEDQFFADGGRERPASCAGGGK